MKKNTLFVVATAALCLAVPTAVSFGAARPRIQYIPSGSMEPTLHVDSYILVQSNPYQNISQVKRGDIIVHTRYDTRAKKPMESIKRVVALPGDTVKTSGTHIFVNGRALPHVLVGQLRETSYLPRTISIWQETNGKAKYRVQYNDNTSPAPNFQAKCPRISCFV